MKISLITAGCLLLLIVITLGLDYGLGVKWYGFIAPQKENIQREVFENTKSYREGKMQDLIRYRLQYLKAESKDEKAAIKSTIIMMFGDYDENKIEYVELREFLKKMKYGEIE